MSVRVLCKIKLPYPIRLEGDFDVVSPQFSCDIFKRYKLTFLFNDENNEDIYNLNLDKNFCQYVMINCVIKDWDISGYNQKIIGKSGPVQLKDIVFLDNIPDEEIRKAFDLISNKFNEIIYHIKENSGMFWLDSIPINYHSGVMGVNTPFGFYTEDTIIEKPIMTTTYYDDFTQKLEVKHLSSNLLKKYKADNSDWARVSNGYLLRAKTALYEHKYHDAIIYAAISAESFIKSYFTYVNNETNDIVLEQLTKSNQYIVHSYYNVTLKYIRKKSLEEINSVLYKKISAIYTLRNKIMHRGYLDINTITDLNFGWSKIEFMECKELIEALQKTREVIIDLEEKWGIENKIELINSSNLYSLKIVSFDKSMNLLRVLFEYNNAKYLLLCNFVDNGWRVDNIYHVDSKCECGIISVICKSENMKNILLKLKGITIEL
ncbi:hypothetical protein ACFPES_12545 [Paenibacillus sp. GCM10023248]|uniref:hypothetical protein n=1 Tax=unclassified Paenibacillus TaxID=185978 RepID=UPI00237949ED|nr:hypothetical protein [Paenibacillus sp. MAHUQ-63]MDD9267857.1 hypothetical protein [Paenibacillus sp. MAHUQ-63]